MGASGYADDLKLLTHSERALRISDVICEKYAKRYDVLFNGKKGMLTFHKYIRSKPLDHGIMINNIRAPRVHEVIPLGHQLNEDICTFDTSKYVSDVNRQCNILLTSNMLILKFKLFLSVWCRRQLAIWLTVLTFSQVVRASTPES